MSIFTLRYVIKEITIMKTSYKVKSRIWIEGKTATFLGEGRVELLEHVLETGSINEASKKMGMSYKKALRLLDTMKSQYGKPLIVSNSGGKGGGGSLVTEEGKRMISWFRTLSLKCESFLNEELKTLQANEK